MALFLVGQDTSNGVSKVPVGCILTKKAVCGLQGHKVKNLKVALFLEGQDASNGVSKVPVGRVITKKAFCGLQGHKVKNLKVPLFLEFRDDSNGVSNIPIGHSVEQIMTRSPRRSLSRRKKCGGKK